MIAIRLLLVAVGWVLVPVAVVFKAYRWNARTPKPKAHFTWRFMWLWDNYEDGIHNDTYWKAPNDALQIIYWSCLRNPANNMRQVPYLSFLIDPKKVSWVGGPHRNALLFDLKPAQAEWFFAWHGFYTGFWCQFRMPIDGRVWRFWAGWKVFPHDIHGVTGHRINGAGFTTQFKALD